MGTAKLTLDATLGGYYSQAAVLTRHLLGTWHVLAYVWTTPAAARNWFDLAAGRKPIVPKPPTIVNGVRLAARSTDDAELKNNIDVVDNLTKVLDEGALPGWMAAAQPSVSVAGFEAFDDYARREWLLKALSQGTVAIALVLHEAARTMPIDQDWRDEFNAIAAIRSQWHTGTLPKRSLRELREARGWDLGETATRLTQDPTNRTQIDETLLDALERRIRAPHIDELETFASVYDVGPFEIDLGLYDRLAVTPRGHVYTMHLHRQSTGPAFIARLTGWKLRNANDESPSAYIHDAKVASDR